MWNLKKFGAEERKALVGAYGPELNMDWIHPWIGLDWIGLGWIGSSFLLKKFDWIGLGQKSSLINFYLM